ncbi:MAG: peptidylprolyl isomerase [Ekhidna sp.]|nr:peptidylprolyl isomerase [Ekhidna sp.]MBC6425039.1 peptidylprolyl isomerase [Ekhidna sp.]
MREFLLTFISIFLLSSCEDKNKDYLVKIKTEYGDMIVLLYDETPLHKKNFLELARSGEYDSTIFHRVIKNFMIQGGNVAERDGTQENPEDRVPAEIVDGFYHTRGSLAAARQGDQVNPKKMSSSTQFYIVDGQPWKNMVIDMEQLYGRMTELLQDSTNRALIEEYQPIYAARDQDKVMDFMRSKKEMVEQKFGISLTKTGITKNDEAYKAAGGGTPHLDGEYTVFGRVVEGLEVIDKIASVETTFNAQGQKTLPANPITMIMEVIEMKKKEITEKYRYSYE